uniref:Transmembrane protein 56-B n=1 Tax=Phallusia mammillata TaxID=59560 RepID=A0A6F9DVE5_9ASCI|nr:transmembrane protein 56-B [Phallusia mammillata]
MFSAEEKLCDALCLFEMTSEVYEACFFTLHVAVTTVACIAFTLYVSPLINARLNPNFFNLPVETQVGCNSRVTTFVYSAVACFGSIYVLSSQVNTLEDFIRGPATWAAVFNATCVCGYCLSDAYFFVRYRENLVGSVLVHHVIVIVSVFIGNLYFDVWWFYTSLRLLTEFSTPFLVAQVTMKAFEMTRRGFYFVNGILTIVFYFVARILFIPVCYWILYVASKTPSYTSLSVGAKLSCFIPLVFMDILNFVWFLQLIAIARKAFSWHVWDVNSAIPIASNEAERTLRQT